MKFEFHPVDPQADAGLLHSWMRQEYAVFWGMNSASVEDVRAEYAGIAANPHHDAWLVHDAGTPAFLMESYAPAHSPLAGTYPILPGDRGMHLLMGPPDAPRRGYTAAAFQAVMEFLFTDPSVDRVVVEPDVRNTKIHRLNARMGFEPQENITLPDKTALLSFCTRAQFRDATHLNSTSRGQLNRAQPAPEQTSPEGATR